MRDDAALYDDGRTANAAWLLRRANYVLADNVRPGGLLVFTTLSELIRERLGEYGESARRRVDEIAASLAQERTFFVEAAPDAHAMTFHGRESVRGMIAAVQPPLRLVRHEPRGWDDHQDVWCCTRER